MGAHTVGRVAGLLETKATAVDFDDTPDAFDNEYFKKLKLFSDSAMTSMCPQTRRPGEAHWFHPKDLPSCWQRFVSLSDGTTDDTVASGHMVSPYQDGCLNAVLDADVAMTVHQDYRYWIVEFAASNSAFHCNFANAFLRTTELGHTEGALHPVGDAPASVAPCYAEPLKGPPSAPPSSPPSASEQPPFSPLASGEAIVQVEVTVVTTQLTVAGDVSAIDVPALEDSLRGVLQCVAPTCELRVTLSAGSVVVTGELTVPTSDSASLSAVSAAANALVTSPPATLSAAIGLTVEAISPTVGVQTRTVAVQVAPPPPSTPPTILPPKGEIGMGAIIGAAAAAAVVSLGVVALVLYRRKRLNLNSKRSSTTI